MSNNIEKDLIKSLIAKQVKEYYDRYSFLEIEGRIISNLLPAALEEKDSFTYNQRREVLATLIDNACNDLSGERADAAIVEILELCENLIGHHPRLSDPRNNKIMVNDLENAVKSLEQVATIIRSDGV